MSVPSGWKRVTLGSVTSDLKSGLSRKLSTGDIGLPVLRSTNLTERGLDLSDVKYWYRDDPQGADTSRHFLNEGDLLINFINSVSQIGKCVLYEGELGRDAICTTNIFRLRLKRRQILPEFFLALTRLNEYLWYIDAITKPAVNQASFTSKDLRKYSFLLPPLPEQRKIAEILGTWDEAIALTERRIAAARQRKQGLMQRLLTGRVRFPEFAGQPWRTTRLRSLVDIRYGKSPNGIRANNGRHPIFGTGGVVGQTDNALCEEPAVIIGRKGSIDRVQLAQEPFWAIDTTFYATPMPRIEARWVYYFLSQIDLRRYNEASGVPSLSRGTLNSIRAEVPSLPEQRRIAGVLVTCDEEIDLLNRKLAALQEQKQGLMQRLLPGRVRVRCEAAGPGVKLP